MLTGAGLLWSLPCAAVMLDTVCGEPPVRYHPVCMIGAWARRTESCLYGTNMAFLRGMLAAVLVIVPWVFFGWGLTAIALMLHPLLGYCAAVGCVYLCLAPTSLAEHARKVADPLEQNDIDTARQAVSMLVGRNTDTLDAHGIARACIESVGENLTDGITATLFWATVGGIIGGVPGAAAAAVMHRTTNCLDALWGKKNQTYIHFGTVAARYDDLLNWMPARLTFLIIPLATGCLNLQGRTSVASAFVSGRNAFQTGWRYRYAHASPNSAWSEAAFAGALHLRLGGPVWYKDLYAPYPFIGEGSPDATPGHIRQAIRLMWASTVLFAGICSSVLAF